MKHNKNHNSFSIRTDPFKKALGETTKAISNHKDLEISFSSEESIFKDGNARIPQISRKMTLEEILVTRGTADSHALRNRFSDNSTFNRYLPFGELASKIYDNMENARCEAIGIQNMPGVASNINARIKSEASKNGYDNNSSNFNDFLPEAVGLYIKEILSGKPNTSETSKLLDYWRPIIEKETEASISLLKDNFFDQTLYAKTVRQFLKDMGYGDQLGNDPDDKSNENQDEDY